MTSPNGTILTADQLEQVLLKEELMEEVKKTGTDNFDDSGHFHYNYDGPADVGGVELESHFYNGNGQVTQQQLKTCSILSYIVHAARVKNARSYRSNPPRNSRYSPKGSPRTP